VIETTLKVKNLKFTILSIHFFNLMFSFPMLEIGARDQLWPNVLKFFFESFYVKRSE
jgi:hypothetical protein